MRKATSVYTSRIGVSLKRLAADLSWPYASFNWAISNFFILRNDSVTRANFVSFLSLSISSRTAGTICQERPNLSFSHPHCSAFGSAESFDQLESWLRAVLARTP
jgi:hypothetical protein